MSNPPNPWLSEHVELLGEAPPATLEVFEETARSIVASNDSPDVPFRWSVNPYRGCFHACAYCYARPTHQYLGWGAGTDFDRRIVVKRNAPELLASHFRKRSWQGEHITFSGVTDCYQPLEASYALTRRCLEVCRDFRNPLGIITKGALVRRDAALLAELAQLAAVRVYVSIPFAEDELTAAIEPFASSASMRFQTLRLLSEAGVPTGVMLAPLIPGLSDSQIPEILERAAAAGATRAGHVLLRLPAEVKVVFEQRLRETLPLRADKVLHAMQELHGGQLYDSRFGARMHGTGPRWAAIDALFHAQCRKHGFAARAMDPGHATGDQPRRSTFRRPGETGSLF
ncbi:MAG TPA: PA0069 family radical SAM protein [Planctomycetota bacterium]|nr:PA0069 family radical SAM protein [Planctomycetota bacterium]